MDVPERRCTLREQGNLTAIDIFEILTVTRMRRSSRIVFIWDGLKIKLLALISKDFIEIFNLI